MTTDAIDVRRLIRIASALLGIAAVLIVILQREPSIVVAETRLAADRDALHSDEVALATLPQLRRNRHVLAERFEAAPGNAGARFLRTLAGVARRRSVHVVSATFERETDANIRLTRTSDVDGRFFRSHESIVVLRGAYPSTLRAIADLSTGTQIVRVDAPNITRDGDDGDIVATIPITIFEPVGSGAS